MQKTQSWRQILMAARHGASLLIYLQKVNIVFAWKVFKKVRLQSAKGFLFQKPCTWRGMISFSFDEKRQEAEKR